jgi:general secretion pathway protein G
MARAMPSGKNMRPTVRTIMNASRRFQAGFTLIELLVVMTVLALLASLVAPRYLERVDTARETVLRQDLVGLRTAIDQFYRDKARYPDNLEELVSQRYIRAIPVDPITKRADTWILLPPKDASKGVFDVKSGAPQRAKDGSDSASW